MAERLAQVSIEHCDAADLVTRLATEETVVYVDPPYLPSTRVGRGRSQRGDYRHEMDEADHRRLAAALARTPATVLISGYPSALYDELYAGWWTHEIATKANLARAGGPSRTSRTERLWSNRPLGSHRQLHLELRASQ